MEFMMRLKDTISVVTGGGQGIGRAICLKLAEQGSTVYIADIAEGMHETVALIKEQGGTARAFHVDIASEEAVNAMAAEVLAEAGRVDNLVNNSGIIGATGHIDEFSYAEWNQSVAVNLNGVYLMCRAVLPGLKQRGGNIVNIASVAAKRPMKCRSPYSTTKAALIGLTRCLATDLGEWNIRVNAICPGRVDGPRIQHSMKHAAQLAGVSFEKYVDDCKATVPLRTFIPPEAVADGVVFLCSEEARYITGVDLNINAGSYMD